MSNAYDIDKIFGYLNKVKIINYRITGLIFALFGFVIVLALGILSKKYPEFTGAMIHLFGILTILIGGILLSYGIILFATDEPLSYTVKWWDSLSGFKKGLIGTCSCILIAVIMASIFTRIIH